MLRFAIAIFVALLALSACSSGSDSKDAKDPAPTGSSTTAPAGDPLAGWNQPALAAAKGLATKLRAENGSECKDYSPLPYPEYAQTASIIKSMIPGAVGDCTAFGQTIEFDTFTDAKTREQFVSQRSEILCRRAKKGKFDLDGIRWASDGNWTVQVDSQNAGLKIARALGGTYSGNACPDQGDIDWEPGAVATVEQLAATLAKNKTLGCTNFELADRTSYRKLQAYNGRLPAAYAKCAGPSGSTFWIAAFSPKTITRDRFIETETKALCDAPAVGRDVEGVRGSDWAIIATNVKAAALAARATGGTALQPAC